MKKLLTAIFTLLLGCQMLSAQHVCGTTVEDQAIGLEELKRNRANAALDNTANARGGLVYIPIKFHLVARTDGTQRIDPSLILEMVCQLNEDFEDLDMRFYIKYPFNNIDNDLIFTDPRDNLAQSLINGSKVSNAMNVFITQNAGGTNTLAYYSPPFPQNDYIVVRKSAVLAGSTLGHEIGHYFSLAHPFFGWENNAWDPAVHGMQVGPTAPLGDGTIFNERQNMSNCSTSADLICDTPPDYLFAFSAAQNGGCNPWNGGAMDPNGEVVDPMEVNIMSYFENCTSYLFTEDQKTVIRQNYNSANRNYIRSNYIPSVIDITGEPILVEPGQGATSSGYDQVQFDWDVVPNAEFYLLEIDFFDTFGGLPIRYVVENASSKIVEGLAPNVTYYWRVLPMGEYANCQIEYSEVRSFTTGTSVSAPELAFVNSWSLNPNPVIAENAVNIELNADKGFDAVIKMYTMTGQLVSANNFEFSAGASNYSLDVSGAQSGMYLVSIQTEAGNLTKKIVIAQ